MVIKVQTDSKGIVDTLLKVGDLGRFINEEGYRKLPNHIMDEVAQMLKEKVLEDTANAQDPSAVPYEPLSEDRAPDYVFRGGLRYKGQTYPERKSKVGANPIPDLRYGYESVNQSKVQGKALDNFEMYRAGASGEAGQRNQIAMVFNNANQGEYMMMHQEGDGVPERRFFPDSDDLMSPNYADFRERVGEILSNYTAELVARRLRG